MSAALEYSVECVQEKAEECLEEGTLAKVEDIRDFLRDADIEITWETGLEGCLDYLSRSDDNRIGRLATPGSDSAYLLLEEPGASYS